MNNWLSNKENRKILSWLAGVVVVVALGMWAASTFLGTNNILNWLLNDENRKITTWIGSGLGVMVTALWGVYIYFDHRNTKIKPKQQIAKRRKNNVTGPCGTRDPNSR